MSIFKQALDAYVGAIKDPAQAQARLKQGVADAMSQRSDRKPSNNQVIQVKEYKNAKEFQKDATKMLAAGWRMDGQSVMGGRVFKNARITVTYLPQDSGS